jgi:hypothetical protein
MDAYRRMVASRPLDEFYLHELEDRQSWDNL